MSLLRSRSGAAAIVLLLFCPAGLPAAQTPALSPVSVLEPAQGCGSLEAVQQAPESSWRPLASALGTSRASDCLWVRVDRISPQDWTLAMPSNRAFSLTTYEPPSYAPERMDAADLRSWVLSFRYLGRELHPLAKAASYACFEGPRLSPDEVKALPTTQFRLEDLRGTQWRSAAFGMMLAMSLFSALFYLALGERVFLKYLGYLLSFVLYLACETRAAHRVLPWGLDPRDLLRVTGMAIDVASAFGFIFAMDFMGLKRSAPRAEAALRAVATLLLPLSVLHGTAFVVGSEAFVQATIHASNLLVGCGALLLLFTAGRCAYRGERYARFFLAGWTPLVVTAFAASIQQLFYSKTPAGILDFMLVAGALESVVLAFGLADRTLGYRRELDRAIQLADRDPLSGLLNRRALLRHTRALDADGDRRGGGMALVLFDLDHFKSINDQRGHAAGDACIRAFAAQLGEEMRRSDLAARYGGEEFVAVLPGATRDAAAALAERVRARLDREGASAEGTPVSVTVSAGVAEGGAQEGFDRLLLRADRALYAAKSAGRNRVVVDPG